MRTLTLRREVLAQLTDAELGAVGAGNAPDAMPSTQPCWTPPYETGLYCLLTGRCV